MHVSALAERLRLRPRLVVAPTVTVLGTIKTRLLAAKKGHQLLKKKVRGVGRGRGGRLQPLALKLSRNCRLTGARPTPSRLTR